ncbi:TetR/AcrR family transcriptional regulator [Nocardiopsis aegyptia]|uniref:TetR/AcrR family transcriptional regulator n=1 Tax=Nocardiopsis aegyptia TaxID=220378 RepID=UPI00366B739A
MSVPTQLRRADARRNRAAILQAARRAVASEGAAVSLALIARVAGVGAGTVHRHFPTKESLIEEVFAAQLHELASRAERRLGLSDPGDAFFALLTDTIESADGRARICEAFRADEGWPRTVLSAAVLRFDDVLDEHLAAAQHSGRVRADVTLKEVKALVTGCVAMRAGGDGARMARLALDVLRADVTKPTATAVIRDTAGTAQRNRDGDVCRMCGVALETRPVGRPARYCGPTCRKRAQRRRHRAADPGGHEEK